MKRLVSLYILAAALPLFAQGKLTLTVDRSIVGIGESVNLTLTLSGTTSSDDPKLPPLQNLQVVAGPYTSTSYEIVNGRTSSSISYIYRLRAVKAGREQVGPVQLTVNGTPLASNQVVVNVVSGSSRAQNQDKSGGDSPDVFIRVAPDKTEAYQGEQITLTYRIYFAAQITQPEIVRLPTASGFWTEELTVSPNQPLTDEIVSGRAYKVGVLRKVALFGTTSGDLTVEPLVIATKVQKDARRRSRDPFDIFNDPFFSLGRQLEPVEAESPSVTIKVRSLPASDKPASFAGAVGSFKIRSMLDKPKATTDEAVTLTVEISGTGNIKTLPEPEIAFPPDVDHYDPKSTEQIRREKQVINGWKRFEYVVIPRAPGDQVIPAITYSFFDPATEKYSTLSTAPLNLYVEKGEGRVSSGSIPVATKRGVESIATDLAFIKTQSDDFTSHALPHRSLTFWLWTAAPWVAITGIALSTARRAKEDQRVASRKAIKQARAELMAAEKSLKSGNLDRSTRHITDAIHLALSAVTEENTEAWTEPELVLHWQERGLDPDQLEQVAAILKDADLIRFAPALADKKATQQLIERAGAVITQLSSVQTKVAA